MGSCFSTTALFSSVTFLVKLFAILDTIIFTTRLRHARTSTHEICTRYWTCTRHFEAPCTYCCVQGFMRRFRAIILPEERERFCRLLLLLTLQCDSQVRHHRSHLPPTLLRKRENGKTESGKRKTENKVGKTNTKRTPPLVSVMHHQKNFRDASPKEFS